MERKQLESLIREILEEDNSLKEEQEVRNQIRQAIISSFEEPALEEDIDHPEKVLDPEKDKVHKDVMTSLDEAKLASKVRAHVYNREEVQYAPYYKEHLNDNREKIHLALMDKFIKKGNK